MRAISIYLGALIASFFAVNAHAFDTTAVTTYLSGDATTGITAIGGALLVLAVLAMAFKWGKAMLFG